MNYRGNERRYWTDRHKRLGSDIRAVGRIDAPASRNQREYADAAKTFAALIRDDFGDLNDVAVLDCGYGQGHYARACAELGCADYVGLDFAAPPPQHGPAGFEFRQQDLSQPFDLGRRFDLVLAFDVLFHVVADEGFRVALDNIVRHLGDGGRFYATGLFTDRAMASHVRHRPVQAFTLAGLVPIGDAIPWRELVLRRFRVRRTR